MKGLQDGKRKGKYFLSFLKKFYSEGLVLEKKSVTKRGRIYAGDGVKRRRDGLLIKV